jgi:hypothetical protein
MSKFGICSPFIMTDFRTDCEREAIIRKIIQNSFSKEERAKAQPMTDSDFFKTYANHVREYERNVASNFGKCFLTN